MKQTIKILYIEHQRKDAELIEKKLKEANVPVESLLVYTKEDFIIALKKITPDLVLAENYFSTFNTMEALEIVKKNVINIPFILISAIVSEQYIKAVIDDGASGHIPTNRVDLLPEAIFTSPGKTRVVIERLKLSNEILEDNVAGGQVNNTPTETPLSGESLYDLSLLEEMDDNDYLAEIISIFLSESPKELKDLHKAYAARDAETINKQAHKFKSSTTLIQANQLSEILAQIEAIAKQGTVSDPLSKLIENAQGQYNIIEASLKKRLTQIRQQA